MQILHNKYQLSTKLCRENTPNNRTKCKRRHLFLFRYFTDLRYLTSITKMYKKFIFSYSVPLLFMLISIVVYTQSHCCLYSVPLLFILSPIVIYTQFHRCLYSVPLLSTLSPTVAYTQSNCCQYSV